MGHPVPNVLSHAPSSREYKNGFMSELMMKDLKLAVESAEANNIPLNFTKKTFEEYKEIVEEGNGSKDFGYLFQKLKNKH